MERRNFLKALAYLPLVGIGMTKAEDPPKRGIRKVAKWTGAERRKLEVTDSRFYEAELALYARNANAAPLGELRCDSLLP